jgi:DNA-binding MarR family transcriptional regulator
MYQYVFSGETPGGQSSFTSVIYRPMQIREIRNLKRWYHIDHSLYRYNRRNEPITKQQLSILLAIYFSSLKSPIVKTRNIVAHLRKHNKAIRPDIMSRQLKELERKEMIKRSVYGRTSLFQLTVHGELELKYLEELNRRCRN